MKINTAHPLPSCYACHAQGDDGELWRGCGYLLAKINRIPFRIMTIELVNAKRIRGTLGGCLVTLFLIVFSVPLTTMGQPKRVEGQTGVVVDYMVAIVNGELITYLDLIWQLALQPNTTLEPARKEDLNRALELLIDQRLIGQEAQKLPNIHGDDKEVEAALAELVRHFSTQEELRQRMTRVGLTSDKLREIIHGRVDIEKYLDFRFRSFVVVTSKEIEDYYREVYVPRFRTRSPGTIIPQIEKVRAEIEQSLTEAKIESSMQTFLDDTRQRAEIVGFTSYLMKLIGLERRQ